MEEWNCLKKGGGRSVFYLEKYIWEEQFDNSGESEEMGQEDTGSTAQVEA